MIEKSISFLKEVRMEVKKINWPTKDQTIRYTLIVLAISGAVALFLGGFDSIFTFILNQFILTK